MQRIFLRTKQNFLKIVQTQSYLGTNPGFAELCLQRTATPHHFPSRHKLNVKFYSTSK